MYKFIHFSTLVILVLCINWSLCQTASAPITCGSSTCGQNESCCGTTCYDTSLSSCLTSSSGQQILCGFEHLPLLIPDKLCGTTCYDSLGYTCCGEQLVSLNDTLPEGCAAAASSTTGGISSSSSTTGIASSTTGSLASCGSGSCIAGEECCASVCYNTSLFSCIIASNGQQILCGFEHLPDMTPDKVCGTTCYDAENYNCCNDQLYSFDESLPTSCGGAPSVIGCGTGACSAGEGCCQNTCYNLTNYVCVTSSNFAQQVLCDFGRTPGMFSACGTTCYDMTQSICCNDVLYALSQFANCGAVANFANGGTPGNLEGSCQSGNPQWINDAGHVSTISSVLMTFVIVSLLA